MGDLPPELRKLREQDEAHKAKLRASRAPIAERDRIDRLTADGLRGSYIRGEIEADEYERDLELLLRRDPDALDRTPPSPVDAILKGVYASWYGDYVEAIRTTTS